MNQTAEYGVFRDSHDAAAWAMLELGRLMNESAERKWHVLTPEERAHLQSVTGDALREKAATHV